MIYNKMNNMLNDKRFMRTGKDPERSMSLQAKLLMSVPSYSTIHQQSTELGKGMGGSVSVTREPGQLPFLSPHSLKSPAGKFKRSNLNSESV